LLVEDDLVLADGIARILRGHGMVVDVVNNGDEADRALTLREVSVAVLDIGLPGIDGFEVVRRLRARGSTMPVLLLTARDDVQDRVRGLEIGADDYLVKPFAIDELLARVRALLRRTSVSASLGTLRYADVILDSDRRTVTRNGRSIDLTKTEFDLLELLMATPEHVLSRDHIYENIWGYNFETGSKSLDVYIGYLRRKLEEDNEVKLIHTVRGVGYTMRQQ
jgi:two-component system response regulator MprA